MKEIDLNDLRLQVKSRMVEASARAESAVHPIMKFIYAGQSEAYEDILRTLGDFNDTGL